MPVRPDLQQLEKCIDDALRKNDFKPLRTLFQIDIHKDVRIKCSKQFLHKLDDLVCRELNKKDLHTVSTILISIGRCCKNITILGQSGLTTMIKQGLVQKEIILSRGQSKDEAVINMTEDLFDLLMVIYDINDEGKKQVVESFVPRICAVLIDSRVNICIQQETLRKMNAILDKMPQDARKMLCNQEIVTLMSNMGERILYAGDYDLQVGIVEALCRMTTEKQRQELSCQWFPMDFIADAFRGIKDCEFETDCRIFLNLVNGMLGDKRSVFTFPCLSAFLDKYELQIPSDEKLEEFWIDFNLGSRTLSFYIAGDDDDRQWEAVTVPEEKVHVYSVEVRESKKLLSLILKNVVKISKREGKELLLYFDESLDITNVTQKLFGANKYKEFARKQGISVAKTSVHILFDASGSQILVPESQSSATTECLAHLEEKSYPPKHMNDSNQEDRNNSQIKITTPSRKKMSEASMIVLDSERYTVRSPILLINTSTPLKRTKPPLKIMSSAKKADISEKSRTGVDNAVSHKSEPTDRRCRGNETDKVIKTVDLIEKTENKDTEFPSQNCNELQDSQTMRKRDKPVLPDVFDNMRGNKMQSKWACWTPVTTIKLCNDQRASIISDMDVSRNSTKQKLLGSDNDPGETQNVNCRKVRDKAEVCKRNNQQQNPPKNPEQISAENARQSDWRIESETTFKSVLLNKTTEESLIYKKTCILSKDVNTTICDNNSSLGKNVTSHTKSVKELTSEYNSCKLKQKMREKSRGNGFTDAAESLIKQISKRYNQTDNRKSTRKLKESLSVSGFSNKSGLQLSKVRKKSYRKLKTTFINVTSECPLNDVYDFCLNSADEPVIKLGIQEFPATAKEASMDNSVKLMSIQNYDGCEPSLKTKDKTIITSHEKKTLLSDTETECGCDDGKTDISRLQKSKSKRQLIDYSRNKNVKKYRSGKSGPSLVKGQPGPAVINQEVPLKNTTKKEEQIVPDGRTRLPRRATKAKKNYKDLSTSESETEQEFSHSRKEQLPVKEKTIHSRTKTMKLPRKQQKLFSTEIPKGLSKEEKNSSELKDNMRDSRFDLSSVSASASSSPVEALRCIEKIPEREFTQDCDYITKSLSPYLKTTSPEFLNSSNEVAGLGNSLTNETMSLCATGSCSPVPELLITPRHTPTKNNTVVKRKNINSVVLTQETQNCNSYSDVSSTSSETHVLEIESPNSSENHTQSKGEESHAASPLSGCSRRERIWLDMPSDSTHASGHSHHHAHKQMYMEDNLSNSSEEEAEGRAYLLPESPCQIDAEHHALEMSGNTPTLPTPDFSIPEDWHNDILGAVMTSIPIKSDHRREISIPANAIDEYVRQTMEVIEHHLKMLNQKVGESRAKIRDKVHFMLQDEMDSLEKDLRALQDLEKEAGDFGQYIQMKLNTHRRNGQARVNRFQTSLDKHSILFNIINEENIFTSEMHLMKQHMKMVQYNFLKEMHEQEVLYIRRGLYALFRAPEGNSNM